MKLIKNLFKKRDRKLNGKMFVNFYGKLELLYFKDGYFSDAGLHCRYKYDKQAKYGDWIGLFPYYYKSKDKRFYLDTVIFDCD